MEGMLKIVILTSKSKRNDWVKSHFYHSLDQIIDRMYAAEGPEIGMEPAGREYH